MPDKSDSSPESSGRPEPAPGSVPSIPDHELIRLIGRGSYGEVWLARNTLGAYRAIKIVYAKTFRHARPFEREFNGVKKFEPVSRLHEGLMDVLHVGRNDVAGYFFCVMELADDVNSGQKIDPEHYTPRTLAHDLDKSKRLPIADCRRIGVAIAEALDFLHHRDLIHRDVKPSNIVFVNGTPKLADIGLVAETSEARSYVGTEGFIPPEGPGTAQSDLYSLGKVLYEISTGKDRHEYPELPADFDDAAQSDELFDLNGIILKACRSDPGQRYKSAAALAMDLRRLSENKRRVPALFGQGKLGRLVTVVVGVGILATLFRWAYAPPRRDPSGMLPGLVSWWRADASMKDEAGGNNGTMAGGGSVTYGPGVNGRALVFDGRHRDRVSVGNPTNLQLQNLTIEAWIKRSDATNISLDDLREDNSRAGEGGQIFAYGRTGYCLGLMNDGRLVFSSVGVDGVFSTQKVADTNWHHVAVTRSGATTQFYLDGVSEPEPIQYGTRFYFDSPAAIGSLGDGLGGTFLGAVDELAIYNRALSDSEIRTRYAAGAEGASVARVRDRMRTVPGLVGWWPGDGDATDLAGGHDGKLMNGAGFAPGKVGRAFRVNGQSQYVMVPRSPEFDVDDQLTVAFWMKPDPTNTMGRLQGLVNTEYYGISICTGFGPGPPGANFYLSSDGVKELTPESCPNTADANDGAAVVTANEWHHLAGTYDGNNLQLYIDGRAWGKPMKHSGSVTPMPTNSCLGIGSEDGKSRPGNKGRNFNGLIDEVCLYRRALSADEIETLYRAVEVENSSPEHAAPH